MSNPHVALVSLTRKIRPAELAQTSAALQKQVLRDLGPLWGLTAAVDAFPDLKSVPLGHWPIVIADNIKSPGLSGFHADKHNQPYSMVQYDETWQLTCSHELCEMLVDPYGNRLSAAGSPDPKQGKVNFLVEVCDPCEDAFFGYSINGILVSDFYTPHYFDPMPVASVRYSYTGAITKPLEVLKNGYLSWLDPVTKRWFQQNCFGGNSKIGPVKGMKTNGSSLRSQMDRIMKNPHNRQSFAMAAQKHRPIQAKTFKAGVARAAEWKTEIARHLKGAKTKLLVWFFLVGLVLPQMVRGQDGTGLRFLTQGELNKILQSQFSNLVTSNKNPNEISTNASLDPTDATFSLKASFPARFRKQKDYRDTTQVKNDKSKFRYIGISVSGSLLDKSYATLFTKGALNSGVNVQGQYTFRLGNKKFAMDAAEMGTIGLQRELVFAAYRKKVRSTDLAYRDSSYLEDRTILERQVTSARVRLAAAKDSSALLERTMDSLGHPAADKPDVIDKWIASRKGIATQQSALDKAQESLDSLEFARKEAWAEMRNDKDNNWGDQQRKDYDSVLTKATLLKVREMWGTLTGGVGKKNFYTFVPTQPFADQINSDGLATFNFGVAFNYLRIDNLYHRTLFFSSTISYLKDNNLASMSTTEVDQTKKIVNAGGDTTRMITTKYNVYTGAVASYLATNWTSQFYYLFGKQSMGIHCSPAITFENNGLTLTNATLGFIMSFKTSDKTQPILNTEFYFTGVDLFDQENASGGLWKRSQVGISFTVPVDLFMN